MFIDQPPVTLSLAVLVAVLAFQIFAVYSRSRKPFALSYPPGPPSTVKIPVSALWLQYEKWGKEYGKLVYLQDRNQLVLNHFQLANELLEKRARIYSDRRVTPLMDLFGTSKFLSVMRYSPEWRFNRKLFQQTFRQAAVPYFYPAQYNKTYEFLHNLITSPENFMQHVAGLSQRVVYESLYGLDIPPEHPLASKTIAAIEGIGKSVVPGFFPLAEKYPFLRFMPAWFPGCDFKKQAVECHTSIKEADDIPFDTAIGNLKAGSGTSLIAEMASKNEDNPEKMKAIKSMGLVSFIAAADTTMSSISSFLLSMCLNPEVQRKGQEELDRVIGNNRLPTFEDRRSLPYIGAIYREVMRLHPPLPLGVAHQSIEDDTYGGYFIPKGCEIIPNIWAMNRDPEIYHEPEVFIPERFLESANGPFGNINDILAYGFGRRVCAGRHMADNTVWLAIASVLATVNISKAKDKDGNEIHIAGEYTDGFFRHPKPYQCSIVPRTPEAKVLVLAAYAMKT